MKKLLKSQHSANYDHGICSHHSIANRWKNNGNSERLNFFEKVGLKLNIQKTKIMASGPITSWQIDGETMKPVRGLTFLDSKITVDGDYSHKIKRPLFLGRKAMTNLDSTLKSREHYFADKGPSSQSYGFSSSHIWL